MDVRKLTTDFFELMIAAHRVAADFQRQRAIGDGLSDREVLGSRRTGSGHDDDCNQHRLEHDDGFLTGYTGVRLDNSPSASNYFRLLSGIGSWAMMCGLNIDNGNAAPAFNVTWLIRLSTLRRSLSGGTLAM